MFFFVCVQDGEDRFRLTLPGYEPYTDQEYKIEVSNHYNVLIIISFIRL